MKPIYYLVQHLHDGSTYGVFSTFDKAEQFIIHNDLDTKMWLIEDVTYYG